MEAARHTVAAIERRAASVGDESGQTARTLGAKNNWASMQKAHKKNSKNIIEN